MRGQSREEGGRTERRLPQLAVRGLEALVGRLDLRLALGARDRLELLPMAVGEATFRPLVPTRARMMAPRIGPARGPLLVAVRVVALHRRPISRPVDRGSEEVREGTDLSGKVSLLGDFSLPLLEAVHRRLGLAESLLELHVLLEDLEDLTLPLLVVQALVPRLLGRWMGLLELL